MPPLELIDLGASDAESDRRLGEVFVDTGFVRSAVRGRRTILLGPKGSGKSALYQRLPVLIADANQRPPYVVPLTPDDFPWADLQKYREDGASPETAHRHIWALTLSYHVARGLATDSSTAGGLRGPFARLRRHVGQSTRESATTDVRVTLSALGAGVSIDRRSESRRSTVATAMQELLRLLEPCLSTVPVIVLLDRLDEEWTEGSESRSLLIGLLMAAKHLNDRFPFENGHGLRVFVFLRSDVYEELRFDDKDKYRSLEQLLVWDRGMLRELLQRRLPEGCTVDSLFGADRGDARLAFDRVVAHTFRRPRDLLQVVSTALDVSHPSSEHLSSAALDAAITRFSRTKAKDLIQELRVRDPDLEVALEALRGGPAWFVSRHELEAHLSREAPETVERAGARDLVEQLFDASAIGYSVRSSTARYRCDDPDLKLPGKCRLHVHPALVVGLDLAPRRAPEDTDEYWGTCEIAGDVAVIAVGGDLDLYVAPRFKTLLNDAVESAKVKHLILDLTDVTLFDSTIPGLLASALQRLRAKKGTVGIVGPLQYRVEWLLEITGMNAVVPLYPTRRAALEAARGL